MFDGHKIRQDGQYKIRDSSEQHHTPVVPVQQLSALALLTYHCVLTHKYQRLSNQARQKFTESKPYRNEDYRRLSHIYT